MQIRLPTVAWAVRRALLGIAILVVAMGGAAILLYASIDPDLDGEPGVAPPSANIAPAPMDG